MFFCLLVCDPFVLEDMLEMFRDFGGCFETILFELQDVLVIRWTLVCFSSLNTFCFHLYSFLEFFWLVFFQRITVFLTISFHSELFRPRGASPSDLSWGTASTATRWVSSWAARSRAHSSTMRCDGKVWMIPSRSLAEGWYVWGRCCSCLWFIAIVIIISIFWMILLWYHHCHYDHCC